MGMRVNPNLYSLVLSGLQSNAQRENQAMQQVGSGQKLNSISDDPTAAATLVNLRMESSSDAQYLQNINSLTGPLQVADSALSSVVEALTSAQTLGVEGANSTINAQNRQALAQQVQGIQQSVMGLANTAYNGQYLFSGTATTTQPYVADGAAPSGVDYNGNNSMNSVEISEGQAMPIDLPGSQLFTNSTTNVFKSLQDLYNALNTNGDVGSAATEVQNAINYVSTQQTFYGNSLQRLNSAQTFLTQQQTQLTETQSNLLDVDMATAITNLSQTVTTQQALTICLHNKVFCLHGLVTIDPITHRMWTATSTNKL
jgi:flagellar hook-associated protein 3 FlgL